MFLFTLYTDLISSCCSGKSEIEALSCSSSSNALFDPTASTTKSDSFAKAIALSNSRSGINFQPTVTSAQSISSIYSMRKS